MLQWIKWSLNPQSMPQEIWKEDDRFIDPFRPTIEPNGFGTERELRESQEVVLAALRRIVEESDVFVFTMGLTEAWLNTRERYVYSMCPGTAAGVFDQNSHGFHNFDYGEIQDDMLQIVSILASSSPDIRVLLTVSPVPLTATASSDHVLTATTYSKSVLRAVAG